MKKVNLFIVMMCLGFLSFAQNTYNVTVCGTINNLNGQSATLALDYWSSVNQGTSTITTDSLGDFCTTINVNQDSSGVTFLTLLLTQTNCTAGGYGLDTLEAVITSDTTLTMGFDNCNSSSNCYVAIIDTVDVLYAYTPNPGAFYSYEWSDGSTSSMITGLSAGTTYCVTATDQNACVATDCYTYTGTNTGCMNVAITENPSTSTLTATVAGGIPPYSYLWDTGEIANTINTPFSSVVCVTVTDSNGCSELACYTPVNTGTCWVDIFSDTLSTGGSVLLTAIPTGIAPYTIVWDNGDTGTTTIASPNQVNCVTVVDAVGCIADECYIPGNNPGTCDVVISYYEDSTTTGLNGIYFSAYPTGTAPFTYNWNFSDGGTSTSANPIYTFTQGTGWAWACVEVIDANGCVASYCDYIQITNPTNPSCYADFYATFDDINGAAGEVFFVDLSYSANGNIVSWDWDLGNGVTSNLQNPSTVYTSAGYYTVCVTTTDANGCTDSYCQTCYIDPSWWTNNPWNTGGNTCEAEFITLQDTTLPGVIYLVDISFGNNLYYTWDFGNGTVINSPYPFINFTDFGWFDVCLTVTDTISGCSDMYCDSVGVDSLGNLLGKAGNWGISVIPSPMPQSVTGSIEPAKASIGYSLYPNPAKESLNLELTLLKEERVAVKLYDITGKLIIDSNVQMNEGINNYAVDISDVTDGVYFMSLKSEQITSSERVIIQH